MPPKSKEDKIQIRQFKSGESSWWVNDAHFYLNASEELIWCSGQQDSDELREALLAFIKRNNKHHIPTPPSILVSEEKEWSTLNFGKHKGLKLNEVKDIEPKYLRWVVENSADKKLVEEIREILKIK
ncbi:MAG TPA: hypothetical protein VLA48_03145 [Nitrososphaeraceae archaeon]|nr:hypothetical protein [Nitrososphaeraceae archaeon]